MPKRSTSNVGRKEEKALGKAYDSAIGSLLPEVPTVSEDAQQVYSAFEPQIATFVQSSRTLMRALDELGKAHPFIQVAVIPFKIALALEEKRRQNDQKVRVLLVQMGNMMTRLQLLEDIIKPHEQDIKEAKETENKIAESMAEGLEKAGSAIKGCSHIIDEYYKTTFIVKFFQSNSWETKFIAFASTFDDLAKGFNSILQIYVSAETKTIRQTTERLDGKLDILMKFVFENIFSREERELANFINDNGGMNEIINDDKLLRELIVKRDAQVSRSAVSSVGPDFPKTTVKSTSLEEIRSQIKTSLDDSLKKSLDYFYTKFREQESQLSKVEQVVQREGDRVIHEILSGPQDKILDKAMYAMWVEMGWKGSAKSRHVVLAIRDFYTYQVLRETKGPKDPKSVHSQTLGKDSKPMQGFRTTEADSGSVQASLDTNDTKTHEEKNHSQTQDLYSNLPVLTEDDIWAIGCINNARLRPLQEALDSDCSGFVTIHELNQFTSARPHDWSLPLWLAYWTGGFEVTLRQYSYRIRSVLDKISSLYNDLMPGNASAYSEVWNSYYLARIDRLVAGIHTLSSSERLAGRYSHNKFRAYAVKVEKGIEERLRKFGYLIDEQNTLSLVMDGCRLEECAFPLAYLILRRILSALKEGKTRILTDVDFDAPLTSLGTLFDAIYDRTRFLNGFCQLRNSVLKEELRRYCYALYYFFDARYSTEIYDATGYYNMPGGSWDFWYNDLSSEDSEDGNEESPQNTGLNADAGIDDSKRLIRQDDDDNIQPAPRKSALVVQHTASCDCCQKHISMTRYMCLTCSADQVFSHTVDLCTYCVDKRFSIIRNNQQMEHLPSHPLLQIRRPFQHRDKYNAREQAKTTLENAREAMEESLEITCSICKKSINKERFWSCCVCYDVDIYICHGCNQNIRKDEPWFDVVNQVKGLESVEGTSDVHTWSHDLVSIAEPEPLPEPLSKSLSVEERLTNLESGLKDIREEVGETREQLKRMENMLQQFIKVPPVKGGLAT